MVLSRRGALVGLGIILFVATMAVGAVTAPDRTIGEGNERTLVGMQGGWVQYGSVFLLAGHDEVWRTGSADSYFEVSMLEDGRVLAAFANASVTTDCAPYPTPCSRTGYRVIDPNASGGPAIVDEYAFATDRLTNRESHAVDATDAGIVFTDMDRERIVLVENETVVWQWNASQFYDPPPDPTTTDWLHINDVDAIGDERFLVSVRNANQLLVLERGAGVVEVINEDAPGSPDRSCIEDTQLADFDGDGDVRCGDPDVIDHQHNPQWLADGAVLVADSDNNRVVELHRMANGSWAIRWALQEAAGEQLHWPRDADRLSNGNTLVTDSLNKRLVEVSPNGTAVWGAPTDRIPYEADRLPIGEAAGGVPTLREENAHSPARSRDDVPVLSLAVAGLQGVSPLVPFWFDEFHMGVTLLAVVFVLVGSGEAVWRRVRG